MRIKTGRDPFARLNIRKRKADDGYKECWWCGEKDRRLWRYYVDLDVGGEGYYAGAFCCVGCLNSHHG